MFYVDSSFTKIELVGSNPARVEPAGPINSNLMCYCSFGDLSWYFESSQRGGHARPPPATRLTFILLMTVSVTVSVVIRICDDVVIVIFLSRLEFPV